MNQSAKGRTRERSTLLGALLLATLTGAAGACKAPQGEATLQESVAADAPIGPSRWTLESPETVLDDRDAAGPHLGQIFTSGTKLWLNVNFTRRGRGSSRIEPGTLFSVDFSGKVEEETFTVGTSTFMGGSGSSQRRITKEGRKNPDGSLATTQKMYERPATWFSNPPWRLYKQVDESLHMTNRDLVFKSKTVNVGFDEEQETISFKQQP
jgi:hypothetical protein